MAVNIFDKYGIKEVANVYFEALDTDTKTGVYAGDIVLFLDTLKVSTIETTAETTDATGGWGNPKLVSWDYGKEITVTLEDALMSLESLRFMLGGAIKRTEKGDTIVVRHTEEVVCTKKGFIDSPVDHITGKVIHPVATYGHPIKLINFGQNTSTTTAGVRTQIVVENSGDSIEMLDKDNEVKFKNPAAGIDALTEPDIGDHIRIFWETVVTSDTTNESAIEVTISPSTFPGTYRVVGDTLIRSQKTGADEAFQFVINKAKVQSEVTFTLEAEGDPSTFEMTLSVLRDSNERGENEMMKLIRYSTAAGSSSSAEDDIGSLTSGTNEDNSSNGGN